jgi:hypothetical protein
LGQVDTLILLPIRCFGVSSCIEGGENIKSNCCADNKIFDLVQSNIYIYVVTSGNVVLNILKKYFFCLKIY